MDLLANYNDDSLHLEDSPSAEGEKKVSKEGDTSLEDEWLSFEKMISPQKPTGKTETSSQYLVHGMVAYPGMSGVPPQITLAPDVEEREPSDGNDSSDEETEKDDKSKRTENDEEDDAFFKMRKRVKERDRSSSSERSSKSSDSSRSRSLSPPQLSPVHSENSQHSLPPPDLFDPTQDAHYKNPEQSPTGGSPAASPKMPEQEVEKEEVIEEQTEEPAPSNKIEETEVPHTSKSKERKTSRDSRNTRKNSHRSRSRSKHKESSKRHRSRSRSKSRRHRHSSKDRHRHRRHRSRDRKRSQSKEKKRSRSREKKNEEKSSSKRRSKSRERKRSKSKERRRSRSRSKGRDRRRSEKEKRSRDKRHRDRSSDRKKRRSRSKSRDRKRKYSRSRSRERLRSRSPVMGKKMTFKEVMRNELLTAGKREHAGPVESSSIPINSPGEILKASAVLASIKSTNASVTPQMALLQTMAAMHQKAQEITGVAVPKYYNPAAVNPLKYAEQVQKRKLLWSKNKQDDKEKEKEVQMESQWKSTQFAADQDGKMTSKFRKLMGIKGAEAEEDEEAQSEMSEEQRRKQDELFSRLDKEYEFARMATHTHRGVGLGFSAQVQFPSTQPPH